MSSEFKPIYLLEALLRPVLKTHRKRVSPTKFKILYQLYLTHKNVSHGLWKTNNPTRLQIAKYAKVSRKKVHKFICSPDFELFGKVMRSKDPKSKRNLNNEYILKPWVMEAFWVFERLGMMRGFVHNFEKWRLSFLKRFNSHLIPLIEKDFTMQQILDKNRVMNKLSTENSLKGGTENPLKGGSPTLSDPTLTEFIANPGFQPSFSNKIYSFQEITSDRFILSEDAIRVDLTSLQGMFGATQIARKLTKTSQRRLYA